MTIHNAASRIETTGCDLPVHPDPVVSLLNVQPDWLGAHELHLDGLVRARHRAGLRAVHHAVQKGPEGFERSWPPRPTTNLLRLPGRLVPPAESSRRRQAATNPIIVRSMCAAVVCRRPPASVGGTPRTTQLSPERNR